MNKQEFLSALREQLSGLPEPEIARSLDYFAEMIDDRMEDGMSEEEAVGSLESPQESARKILYDMPLPALIRAKRGERRMGGWQIALLILGFPVWGPLLIAGAAVVFALYASVWALIFSCFAVVIAFAVTGVAMVLACPIGFFKGMASGLLFIGSGLVAGGLGILLFFPVVRFAKWLIELTKKGARLLKTPLVRKEAA